MQLALFLPVRRPYATYRTTDHQRAHSLRAAGYTARQIAQQLGGHHSVYSVEKMLQRIGARHSRS